MFFVSLSLSDYLIQWIDGTISGVTRAMESQSMFGDKKPNCVILDEIDGADAKGAIQAVR